MTKKHSIVIPTYNHCDDLLKPCIESIKQYTDMNNVEIIVVANGCTDETKDYVASLSATDSATYRMIWVDDAVGYTKATNLGIKNAVGEFVILLNNDTQLLEQSKNLWLQMLEAPFADPDVGLAGPLQLHDDYADADVLIFFCVMIRKTVFDKIGLLDEIFSPGGGEDIDFTIRAKQAGFKSVQTTPTEFTGITNSGGVPIWHKDNKTFVEIPEYTNWIVKRNGLINCKRYNKDIKLNLGGGGVDFPGFLTVDLYDKRADILMDITKLDFDDNSVSEIIASHVFEHLNPYHSIAILSEWRRVLKPGGKLIMEMPDIEKLCARFVGATTGERYGILNAIYGSVNTTNEGGPDNITSPHLFGWWPQSITDHLFNSGYTNIQIMPEQWAHPEANFRVEAINPAPVKQSSKIDHEKLKKHCYPVYKEIFEDNVYRAFEEDISGKTVLDIGANAGYFSLRCTELNAKQIIAVEAQPSIYNNELLPNIIQYPSITPILAAAYHTDGVSLKIVNNGINSRLSVDSTGEDTTTVSLPTLMKDLIGDDLVLKMDCEGGEYDILLYASNQLLRRFETIFMETHLKDHPIYKDVNLIHVRLESAGFKQVHSDPMMLYMANDAGEQWCEGIIAFAEKWIRV